MHGAAGFSFFIARRYLVSKKTHNLINLISGISISGIAIGTMALIVVLSVFNGFEGLVLSLFNKFNPDIQIVASEGKTFNKTDIQSYKLREFPGVANYAEVIEENALLKYRSRQFIATLKGVSESYIENHKSDSIILDGVFLLQKDNQEFSVMGYGVAYTLGINLADYRNPVEVYIPSRTKKSLTPTPESFKTERLIVSGVFSIQQEYDNKYIYVSVPFMQKLLDYDKELTSIELCLSPGTDIASFQKSMEKKLGSRFSVKNRFQQQELLYRILRSERWAIFFILTFILLIATFNVIGSLTMLILEKRNDIRVLWSLGCNEKTIRRIFILEGMFVVLAGAIIGLFMGFMLCILQQEFGLVKLGSKEGAFLVNAYPVDMRFVDFLIVTTTVLSIGYISAFIPVRRISRRFVEKRIN